MEFILALSIILAFYLVSINLIQEKKEIKKPYFCSEKMEQLEKRISKLEKKVKEMEKK